MGCPECTHLQFHCQSGQCIDMSWVCDGNSQCPDGSDEVQCCLGSTDSMFQCVASAQCVPATVVCDGWSNCPDGSDETPFACQNRAVSPSVTNAPQGHATLYILILVSCLASCAAAAYRCRKKFGSGNQLPCEDSAADPLSPKPMRMVPKPNVPKPTPVVRMTALNGTSSSSYDRSHVTGASSSASLLCYPLNPPPSPATTAQREDYCCPRYRDPPPTPCSTMCDESDSTYRCDSEPFPPPPTPRSHSSGPPSPSSSTYFHPHPLPPPPSPNGRCPNC